MVGVGVVGTGMVWLRYGRFFIGFGGRRARLLMISLLLDLLEALRASLLRKIVCGLLCGVFE